MTTHCLGFDRFVLDPADRRLTCDGSDVEVSARYLDVLALLVRDHGRLVSKDRFLAEVWRGVPVTDEALTQAIKTLRRALGDDAAAPRFIETVPKHGYRFIAPVERLDAVPPTAARSRGPSHDVLLFGAAGTLGGAVAGLIGGIAYGFAGASQAGVGAVSLLLVLACVTMLMATIGAAGVAFGIALAGGVESARPWRGIGGGAGGGLVVGGVVKLLGLDAFTLLVGRSPGDITGATEGLALGAAVGLGVWLARAVGDARSRAQGVAAAAAAGALAGILIPLGGGRLMAGSLDLLARGFPESRLHLDRIGALFGEVGLGPVSRSATGALEGALFAGCIAGAMLVARRRRTGAVREPSAESRAQAG